MAYSPCRGDLAIRSATVTAPAGIAASDVAAPAVVYPVEPEAAASCPACASTSVFRDAHPMAVRETLAIARARRTVMTSREAVRRGMGRTPVGVERGSELQI